MRIVDLIESAQSTFSKAARSAPRKEDMDSGHKAGRPGGFSEPWSYENGSGRPHADIEPQATPPVFVHSAFRSSSTWLWARMRAAKGTMAFYECFSEALGDLQPGTVVALGPDSWRSRHPANPPYFMEFLPLLREAGGVESFDPAFGLPSFIPQGGPEGALSDAQKTYVESLIHVARQSGRTPILTCTRSMGRIGALKAAVGGTHICLRRKLLHQWNSFSGQRRTGNPYFIDTLFDTIRLNTHDPYLGFLQNLIAAKIDQQAGPASQQLSSDDIFVIFVGLHVYAQVLAARHADLFIDIARLQDDGYRATVTREIHERTGIDVDLADVHEQVDYPEHPLADPDRARAEIDACMVRALNDLKATPDETAEVRNLIDELWADHRLFSVYTSALGDLAREKELSLAERLRISQEAERLAQARAGEAERAMAAQASDREAAEQAHAAECAALRTRIVEIEALGGEQTGQLAQQAEQLAEQSERLAQQAGQLAGQDERLVQLEEQQVEREQRLVDQALRLREEEQAVKSLDEAVAALQGELERARIELSTRAAEAADLGDLLADARRDQAEAAVAREALQARLADAHDAEAAASDAREALERRVEALVAEIALWTQRFDLYQRSRVFRAMRAAHRIYFQASQRLSRLGWRRG